MMNEENIKITFLMPVTINDVLIACYSIESYEKLYNNFFSVLPFKLKIYSNSLPQKYKDKYFDEWKKYPFVEIYDNNPKNEKLFDFSKGGYEGNYEAYHRVMESEFRNFTTPYWAMVDADFEILDPQFIVDMVSELDENKNLVAMTSDYVPYQHQYYELWTKSVVNMWERYGTWFCIYKKEATRCDTSMAFYSFIDEMGETTIFDTVDYFNAMLKKKLGYELKSVDYGYQGYFVHYWAFSKNKSINQNNIREYRKWSILQKRGLGIGGYKHRRHFKALNDLFKKFGGYMLNKKFPKIYEERFTNAPPKEEDYI